MKLFKGQISIEFMIIFSFILVVFLFLFALITQQRAVTLNSQTFSQLQLVAQTIALQISRASQAGAGYSALIPITTNIGNLPYNVSVTKSGTVIVATQVGTQIIRTSAYSNIQSVISNPAYYGATNSIYVLPIANGSIYLQNSFGSICIDYQCPINSNQSIAVILSSQITHIATFNGQYLVNYVSVPQFPTFNSAKPFSITFWMKKPIDSNSDFFVSSKVGLGAGDPGVLIWKWTGANSILFRLQDSGTAYEISTGNVNDNNWHFVTATYDGSQNEAGMKIYVDNGAPGTGSSAAIGSISNSNHLGIGGSPIGVNPLTGEMGNVQIYNTTLSASQVSQLYNEGITGAPLQSATLYSWWPLNGNANDYSGNGNNGAINGPTIFPAIAQIFAKVTNPLGQGIGNVLVGFATTLGNFTNGIGSQQGQSSYTNSNGIATIFVNQQGNNGQAFVKATAFSSNMLPQSSLVAWYPLNTGQGGVGYDLSGNKNNGAFIGQPSWSVPNYAASFSGNNTGIETPLRYAYGTANAVTITGWIYLTTPTSPAGVAYIMNSGFSFAVLNSHLWFYTAGLGNTGGGTILPNTWTFVTAKISGPTNPTITLYINGVQISSTAYSGNLNAGCAFPTEYFIASAQMTGACAASSIQFPGYISNLQVYNSSLSSIQISNLYSQGISAPPLASQSLAGWWPLDGNANDYGNGGKNGSIHGGVSFAPIYATAPVQQIAPSNSSKILSASFNGVSSFVNIGSVSKINSASNWSISFWMNSTSTANYGNPLDANFIPAGNNAGPRFEQGGIGGSNSLNLILGRSSGSYNGFTYSNAISQNVWYHVVAARSGNTITGYLNGVQVLNAQSLFLPTAFPNLTVGRGFANSANRWYSGNVVNLEIYNQTLSPSQSMQLYQEGLGGTPLPYLKLIGWWPLNGNANNQTINSYNSPIITNVIYKNTLNYVPAPLSSSNYSGVNFNGQTSYLATGINSLPSGSSARSVFAWIYPTNVPSNLNTIQVYGTGVGTELSGIYLGRGNLNVYFAGFSDDFQTSLSVSLNSWHFVGYTYSGSQVTVYVDGKSQSKTITSLNTVLGSSSIGYDLPEGGGYFGGSIADVQIYNTLLNTNQVQQLYNSGIPPSASSSLPLSWSP